MTFRRGLMAVAGKEFRHLRHDPYTLILAFAMPLFGFLLFGYALETRVHDVPTAVQNLDSGRYSRELIADFSAGSLFRLDRESSSQAELLDRLKRGDAKVAIQILPGYSTAVFYGRPAVVRVWVDGSDAVLAGQAVFAAQAIGFKHSVKMALAGFPVRTSAAQLAPELLFNPEGRASNYFVPALSALLGETTTLLLVALSVAKEYERGTLDQLRITSIPLSSLIAGKLLSCATIGIAVGGTLISLMHFVFDVPIAGSSLLLCAAMLAFQGPALGLGLILTAEARNQAQALQLTYFVFMPAILLSGMVFPRETMPNAAKALSALLPTTWSIQILRGIVLRGETFAELIQPFTALAILTVLFLVIGTWRLRVRLG
jgi:ABC-2 type transport system permease protein